MISAGSRPEARTRLSFQKNNDAEPIWKRPIIGFICHEDR
jgi:hypothetical protein